ncbi:hypothetical protein BK131_29770 [Paenibacillus amylolyticus]|uniref:Uncharacterized protein n=1 Tax=Paenibacillus amylolyticus TaxID=1451 RepID=A0A1R1BE08_PAEAM|nr:hypothetical protein [Paenibacillus amylolyticus]OMF04356.1 hypothetical protein BK131_29770 [Paenibacillus amylolyticus]
MLEHKELDINPTFQKLIQDHTQTELPPDRSPINVMLVEPFTLGWVAVNLAEGIIAAMGAMIFNSLFNNNADLGSLQRETLIKIGQIVREAIQEDAIRSCVARIDAISNIMRQYLNAPDTSLDRLQNATDQAVNLVAECRSLGFKAILPQVTAVCLLTTILEERRSRFNEQGENKNIADILSSTFVYLWESDQGFAAYSTWFNSRFSELVFHPEIGYFFWFDNEKVNWNPIFEEDKAIKLRKEYIDRESAATHEKLFGPSWDIALSLIPVRDKYQSA